MVQVSSSSRANFSRNHVNLNTPVTGVLVSGDTIQAEPQQDVKSFDAKTKNASSKLDATLN